MRVLFTTVPAKAHVYNLVPMAWALRAAGHEVRVAGHPDAVGFVTDAGLTAVPVGRALDQERQIQELRERQEDDPTDDVPFGEHALLRMDELRPEKLTYDFMQGVFTGMTATVFQNYSQDNMVDDLVAFARAWRPDLVIWDTLGLAGPVAARACGAAHARMLYGLDLVGHMRERYLARMRERPPELREDPLAEWLGWTLGRHGRGFTEDLVLGQWTIDSMPSWARLPVDHPYVPVRHIPYNGPAEVPAWMREAPGRRRICVTLGVSFREVMGGDQVPANVLLDAVAGLDVEVVATLDTGQLASARCIPDNVRIVDFAPLNELLPSCAAMVHQGGTGTLMSGAAHGIPHVILPTDIWDNVPKARRVQEYGAGLCLPGSDGVSAAKLREMLERVLAEPSFTETAARWRNELLGAPAPREVVPVLEELTAAHR